MTDYLLTGVGWSCTGTPDELLESLKEPLRRLLETIPEGEARLTLDATLTHHAETRRPPGNWRCRR